MKDRLIRAIHEARDHLLMAVHHLNDENTDGAAEEFEAAAKALRAAMEELAPV